MSVNIALRRQIYQLQYYTEGNIPEALIGVPDTWNPDQIRQFQAYWDALNAGDTAERRHAKFVPGGVAKTFIPTREPVMKDVFDEWLARIICYAFSVSPSAFTAQVNRATAETAQETALAEGLAPLQNWVKQLVDAVIAREFQAPDLEFAWDQDKAVDPSEVAHIAASYVAAGIKSANEVRAELGLAPVPGGDKPQAAAAQGRGGKAPAAHSPSGDATDAAKADTLRRSNPNHYGPGDKGGQFAPADQAGSGSSSAPAPPKSVQVASNDQGGATDTGANAQVAQGDTGVPLGIATARVVLAREVAEGRMSQAKADEMLEGIARGDSEAIANVNVVLRIRSGIPENWTAEPAGRAGSGQGGLLYRNPDDPYDNVRIMPGNPQSSNPAQREPYVVDQKGENRFLTRNGDRVEGNRDEMTHIPFEDYRFDKR